MDTTFLKIAQNDIIWATIYIGEVMAVVTLAMIVYKLISGDE